MNFEISNKFEIMSKIFENFKFRQKIKKNVSCAFLFLFCRWKWVSVNCERNREKGCADPDPDPDPRLFPGFSGSSPEGGK